MPADRIQELLEQLHSDLSDVEFERIKEQIYLEIEKM